MRPDRVRIHEHPGRAKCGISGSRNLGLEEARGRLRAFLDADDVWLPEKLERQVALLDAHPEVAMTYGAMQRWYGWTVGATGRCRCRQPGRRGPVKPEPERTHDH